MSKSKANTQTSTPLFYASIALAVILSIISCTFFLLIPTQSINVDTVYEGF